jgi:hypothetical protein
MNLYTVTYKHYTGEKIVRVVADTIEDAMTGTRFVQRQRHQQDTDEIVTVEKILGVDRVQK